MKKNMENNNIEPGKWIPVNQGLPKENETVWIYNEKNNFVALGCIGWIGSGEDGDGNWIWAISNGIIYSENGKIVSECEPDDDYEITHWCSLPEIPNNL